MYALVVIWECEWDREITLDDELRRFVAGLSKGYCATQSMTEEEVCQVVLNTFVYVTLLVVCPP